MTGSSGNLGAGKNPSFTRDFQPPLQATRSTKKARMREEGGDEDNPPSVTYKETLVGPSQFQEHGVEGTEED